MSIRYVQGLKRRQHLGLILQKQWQKSDREREARQKHQAAMTAAKLASGREPAAVKINENA